MNTRNIKTIAFALLGGAIGFTSNLVNNMLAAVLTDQATWVWIGLVTFLIIFSIVLWAARPRLVSAQLETPLPLRTPSEQEAHAHRGLILAVSLYRPGSNSPAASLSLTERQQAAAAGDYALLDLAHSNLAPLLHAIEVHSARLQHIWLITTVSGNQQQPGSDFILPALKNYVKEILHLNVEIHAGQKTSIPLEDDALITVKTRDLVNQFFSEANQFGMKDEEIVADVTGGTRSIQLGLILACLDRRRKVQLIGTHYNQNGDPDGSILPILLVYSPVFQKE